MSTYEQVVLNRVPISRKKPVGRRGNGYSTSPLRKRTDNISSHGNNLGLSESQSSTFVNGGLIPCHCWNPNSELHGKPTLLFK